MKNNTCRILSLLFVFCSTLNAPAARADSSLYVTGHVQEDNGRSIAGALVAVYDDSNRVIDYARTDSVGNYALCVPRSAFHLDTKRGRGFIADVTSQVGRFVGEAAGFVANPVRAGVKAVASSQVAAAADPLTRGGLAAGAFVADKMLAGFAPDDHKSSPVDERKQPGAVLVKVVRTGHNDLVGVGRVFWVQKEQFSAGGKAGETMAAWLDSVVLTAAESEAPSRFDSEPMRFTAARLDPSIVQLGQHVHITAKLRLPADPPVYAQVVARNNRTGQKWELLPAGNGLYEADILVDKRFPRNDQVISVLAYASKNQRPGRRPDAESAIEAAGLWDAKRPFRFNPLLVVSRNRADLTLTVVSASR